MVKHAPQKKLFELINRLIKIKSWLFYISILLAIIPLGNDLVKGINLKDGLKSMILYSNLLAMIGYSVIIWILEYYLIPKAEETRRADFFDNSFGTAFNFESSEGYFTNEEIKKGLNRFTVNLFQNCFWSFEISRRMLVPSLIKSLAFALIMFTVAFWGFKNVPVIIPLFQVFLSAYVVSGTVKLYRYNSQVQKILSELKEYFDSGKLGEPNKVLAKAIRMYVSYECNISWGMVQLNSKLFDSLNDELEDKWSGIKKKYRIDGVK